MDPLTLFGALAVGAMLVFYALEARSAWFVLAIRRRGAGLVVHRSAALVAAAA
jgi:hypothetical protein